MKIFVLGKRWKVTCFNDKTYERRLGDGSNAMALLEDRKIYIKRSSLNVESVAHEIVHAYLYELSYVEMDLDESSTEEFFCELIGKRGEAIIKDSKMVVKFFSR